MNKIITDKNKIKEVLKRGVEQIFPDYKTLERKLLKGERIRLYCGFDPSAASLHIGNAIQINKLAQFQELGHEVVFLVGDFTGMIGDPTDKAAVRKKLAREEVVANSKNYQKQASAYLDFSGPNPARIMYNSEWLDKLSFRELIELSSHFTVQQMIQRDMFQERLKAERPIHLHEFLYPLAQGYDSAVIGVDLEIGGNDQMFNMLCGRDLMKALGKKEKFVMTTKLLVDPAGKKMGKTEGNIVNLDAAPENMYGAIMAWPDGVIGIGFELCTGLPMDVVDGIYEKLNDKSINPRDLKMKLAFEITRINHGDKKAKAAEENFIKVIQKKEAPEDVKSKKLEVRSMNIIELLVKVDLAASKSEARRLIMQNGIKINGKVINDIDKDVKISKSGTLLQRGKRQFVKITR